MSRELTAEEDFLLANGFLYYVRNFPLLTDKEYDAMEKAALKSYGCRSRGELPKGKLRSIIGSEDEDSYPPHVRALALYLGLKYGKRKEKPSQFSAKSQKKIVPRSIRKLVLKKRSK